MEKDVYSEFLNLEKNHWWFLGRRSIFFSLLDKFLDGRKDLNIIDVGCGPGEMIEPLEKYGNVTACDITFDALDFCSERGFNLLMLADGSRLPVKDESYDLLSLFDTLEHIDDDVSVLRDSYRVLKDGAFVIITLPAYNFLFSNNDRAAHHKRRYSAGEISRKAQVAGFNVRKVTYINTFLFPVIFSALILIKIKEAIFPVANPDKTNISFSVPQIINSILASIFCFESRILKNISFPFGHSLVCIAQKKK